MATNKLYQSNKHIKDYPQQVSYKFSSANLRSSIKLRHETSQQRLERKVIIGGLNLSKGVIYFQKKSKENKVHL